MFIVNLINAFFSSLLPDRVTAKFPRLDAIRYLTLLVFSPLGIILSILHGFLTRGIPGIGQKINNMVWVTASTYGGLLHALKGKRTRN